MVYDAEPLNILIFIDQSMKIAEISNEPSILKTYLIVGAILLLPLALYSQDAAPGTLLPDIDPQDIEIRGEFVARFPGIMRQPILGFSPRPRVFQIDPNRMPYLESPEQVVASLPLSDLERPLPPLHTYYKRPERFNLWSSTGIGNYMAPEVDIFMGLPLGRTTMLTGNLNSVSSGSYLEDESQTSSFRNLNAGLGLVQYIGSRSRLDAGFRTRWDRNHLANSLFTVPYVVEDTSIPEFSYNVPLSPDNNMTEHRGNLGYRFSKNQYTFFDVGLESSFFKSDVAHLRSGPTPTDSISVYRADFREIKHGATLRTDWVGRRPGNVFSVQLGGNYSEYNLDGTGKKEWYIANAGFLYRTRIGYRLHTRMGLRAFYSGDVNSSGKLHVYPEIDATFNLTPEFKIKGEFRGFVHNAGIGGLSLANRRLFEYYDPENERGFLAKGAVELNDYQGLKVQSGLQYTYYLRHAYYTLANQIYEDRRSGQTIPGWVFYPQHEPTNQLMTYAYLDGANIIKWDASVWYDLMPELFTIYGGVYLQWHGDSNGDEIPFRENIGLSAGGTYSFTPRSRVHIWTDFTGSRKVATGLDDSKGYVLLNAKFDFWASREIGAYIKVTNLLDQRYSRWVGYDELPAQVYGGVMIKF